MLRFPTLTLICCLLVFALAACGRGNSGALSDESDLMSAADAEPTVAAVPTFTPTPEPPLLVESGPVELELIEAAEEEIAPEEIAVEPASEVESASEVDNIADILAEAATGLAALGEGDGEDASLIAEAAGSAEELELSVLLAPTPTPAPAPHLIITSEAVNIRNGPGTVYAQIGAAAQGEQFGVIGRNAAGDWWQVCCIGDQPGWIFAPLGEAHNIEQVTVGADIPEPPEGEPVALPVEPQPAALAEPEPVEAAPVEAPAEPAGEPEPVAEAPSEPEPEPASPPVEEPAPAAAPPGQPAPTSGTAGNFDPNAQYQIVHYHMRGFDDNNGGVFNPGGQHMIFLTVLDEAGNGLDGVVVKNAVADNLTVVTGDKGPGMAEIRMYWDPYKLFVAQDGSGPVTSQVSNQMSNPFPHIPDVIGRLGPADLEYAICPRAEDRCDPPFYHAHWSYEITFQKVR